MKPQLLLLAAFIAMVSCGGDDPVPTPKPPTPTPSDSTIVPDTTGHDTLPDPEPENFARGADISWYSEMEDMGKKFYSWNHRNPMDCPAVMHDLGLNAGALRVLVDPADGYCGLDDLLRKARRVAETGMDLLVSFHYSDTIASATMQRTPPAWQGHTASQLAEDARAHTYATLQALATAGIEVRWIQIGNDMAQGLMWPEGDITRHSSQYAAIVTAACHAARSVFPDASIIVAAGSPLNQPALCNALDVLHTDDYDMVGLSLYPTLSVGIIFQPRGTSASYIIQNENDAISYAMQSVDLMYNRYRKPCIVVEAGEPASMETAGSAAMRQLVLEARNNSTCQGVFYWEPEAYDGWKGYTQGAFLSNGHPTQIIDALTQ